MPVNSGSLPFLEALAFFRNKLNFPTQRRTRQMKDVAAIHPYWRYRHSPASTDPRPEHVAWDRLILKHDDPWWSAHTPPNGFGCKCYIETLADRDMKKQGLTVADKDKIPFPNSGVDKGWDYQPGASVAADLARLEKLKEDKLRRMSDNNNDFLEGRSRPRGELPKQAKPTEPGTISVDQLSKMEGDAKAYVLSNGKKTGHEYMTALDLQSGKRLAQDTSHDPGRVYIPPELTQMANNPDRKIAYHHDHPDSFSISPGDFLIMAKRPGLYEIVAYGHDGSRFLARRRDVHDLESMLDVAKIELRHQSQWAAQRGLSLQGLEAHVTNLALQQAGLIDYEFELDQERERFCQKEQSALNKIVAALAARIKQMRAKP